MDNPALQRILHDPLAFAESLLIEPITESPFRANYVQRQVLSAVNQHRRIAVRVSRQTGKTYALTVICLWAVMTRSKRRVVVITPDRAKGEVIFKNIDMFLEANPAMKSALVRSYAGNPYTGREFSNGSVIYGFTAGSSSNRKASSVRGQGGDVIIIDEAAYLNDEDWIAIEPIIQGGLYRSDALTVVSSTPNPDMHGGVFYDIFTKPQLADVWHRIHVPITENPDFAHLVDKYRAACPSELVWTTEYLADFPDQASQSLMRRSQVQAAGRKYHYNLHQVANGPRAIGVDWDKYDAGVNIVVVRYDLQDEYYQVMYREEMPPEDTLLMKAVRRVLQIQDVISADYVVVDRGYGEMQLEVLRTEMAMRSVGGANKVIGYSFQELVDFVTEHDAQPKRIRLKDAAYQWLAFLVERGRLIIPEDDEELKRQMLGIQVKSTDSYGMRFRVAKDHAVSALSLALWQLRDCAPYWQLRSAVGSAPVVIEVPGSRGVVSGGLRVVEPVTVVGGRPSRSFAGTSFRRDWR